MATLKEILGEAYKDGMTVEEIETALATKKIADISTGAYVSVSKYQALEKERDGFKQKWSDTLTEAQKAEQRAIEEQNATNAIKRENIFLKKRGKLLKTIKDEQIVDEIANLWADGKYDDADDKYREYEAKSREELEKQIKADLMKQNPQPNPQGQGDYMTSEQFAKLPLSQKQKIATENPELYKKFTTQGD